MKVYIATSGEYSDYHISAVFTDREKANRYANLLNASSRWSGDMVCVEDYDTDDVTLGNANDPILVYGRVDIEDEEIHVISVEEFEGSKDKDKFINGNSFYVDITTHVGVPEIICEVIPRVNEEEDVFKARMQKIIVDTWYQYKAEHPTEVAKLIEKVESNNRYWETHRLF